jgi:hypothetical protein
MSKYKSDSFYDIIILGAGIAGLHIGIELLKRFRGYKQLNICILEKYDYVGGRILTFKKDIEGVGEVQWEIGAGRISKSHKKVLGLLRHYGLHFSDISSQSDFLSTSDYNLRKNTFSELSDLYLKPFENLPSNILENNTLGDLLETILGKVKAESFYNEFPYYSEIHTLRADLALKSFQEEMGNDKFVTCIEGLSALTDAMNRDFQELGGTLIKNMEVLSVEDKDSVIHINCKVNSKECKTIVKNKRNFSSKVCISTLHSDAISHIIGLKEAPVLKYLSMEPLLRTYAIFPQKDNTIWFNNLPKIVTNSSIRYIIPINPKKGVIMISYTDGKDAQKLIHKKDLENWIMKEIRSLFPNINIPDPILFKKYPWESGCTYWLPGDYNVLDESIKSLHPFPKKIPGLYMCGESFAVKQCWMESALEQSDILLSNNIFIKSVEEVLIDRI